MTTLDMAHAEREELAELLTELTPRQWEHATLCEGWCVREVVAHVVSYDDLTPVSYAKRQIRARLNMDRFNAIGVDTYATYTPAQMCQVMREHVHPHGYMAAFGGIIGLLDAMIHQQDIRRPSGIPRTIPALRLRAALGYAMYVPLLRGAWRSRGLRLIATDVDWAHGRGPEVHAHGEALLMALAGRRPAYCELAGRGSVTLIQRLT